MATRADLTTQAPPSEQETEEFFQRLDEWRKSLSDREQYILASLVVHAADGQEGEDTQSEAQIEPTDEELDAFADRLDQFHDELGDKHVLLDGILLRSVHRDDKADVEGYQWAWFMIVPAPTVRSFQKVCTQLGGRPMRPQRLRGNRRYRAVGCVMP
jgi:hypothetical protein